MAGKDDIVRFKTRIEGLELKLQGLKRENENLNIAMNDLNNALERYRLIADFAHDWEMWFRPDGSLEYVSPSFQSISGYTADELLNSRGLINQLIHPDDLALFTTYINDAISLLNIRQSLNFRILTRTKQVRWCEIRTRGVYDKRGKYLGQRASVNDVTRLMQALGEIRNLSDGKKVEVRAKEKYMRDLESKDRELFGFLMSVSQKNETLQYVRNNLRKLKIPDGNQAGRLIDQMISHIDDSLFSTDSWDNFRSHFENLHPGFFDRLNARFPALTAKDMKLSAYLRLQLSTKEIALLLNITPQSAEISRVRLRKKLGLARKTSLTSFMASV